MCLETRLRRPNISRTPLWLQTTVYCIGLVECPRKSYPNALPRHVHIAQHVSNTIIRGHLRCQNYSHSLRELLSPNPIEFKPHRIRHYNIVRKPSAALQTSSSSCSTPLLSTTATSINALLTIFKRLPISKFIYAHTHPRHVPCFSPVSGPPSDL